MNQVDQTQIATNKAALISQMDAVPRMTKRVKTYKPKEGLTKAQVQTLVAMMKAELEALEWSIVQYSFSAKELKSINKDRAELCFKRMNKARVQRNKLSRIQSKLKRGLV